MIKQKNKSLAIDKSPTTENLKLSNIVSGFVAERKFIRFAIASISPKQFKEIIKDQCSYVSQDIMIRSIEKKIFKLNNKQTINLWNIATNKGIVPAMEKLYTYFKNK